MLILSWLFGDVEIAKIILMRHHVLKSLNKPTNNASCPTRVHNNLTLDKIGAMVVNPVDVMIVPQYMLIITTLLYVMVGSFLMNLWKAIYRELPTTKGHINTKKERHSILGLVLEIGIAFVCKASINVA